MPANEQQAMRKMPYWATNMSIQQLGTYLPPADTLPSVMPIHMYDRDEYDEVEVHPCTQDEIGCEQCEPDDPELAMWSCYLHCKVGGIECVADFANEKEADAYALFLRAWLGLTKMTQERSKTIQDMRHEGYAVVVWSPDELRGVDPIRVEDRMIEKGGDYIEQISPEEEEVGVE